MNCNDLDRLLRILADLDGSDIHIKAGAPPRVRIDGLLRTLENEGEFTDEDTLALARAIMPPRPSVIGFSTASFSVLPSCLPKSCGLVNSVWNRPEALFWISSISRF